MSGSLQAEGQDPCIRHWCTLDKIWSRRVQSRICFACSGVLFMFSMSITISPSCIVAEGIMSNGSRLRAFAFTCFEPSLYSKVYKQVKLRPIFAFWQLPFVECLYSRPAGPVVVCDPSRWCSGFQTNIEGISLNQKIWQSLFLQLCITSFCWW